MEETKTGRKSKIWMFLIPGSISAVILLIAAIVFNPMAIGSIGKVLSQTYLSLWRMRGLPSLI